MLYFGFYNDKIYTQREIADIMSLSKPYVSKLITKLVKMIGEQLKRKGIIELKTKQQSKSTKKG